MQGMHIDKRMQGWQVDKLVERHSDAANFD
jgi:hypothetical protein